MVLEAPLSAQLRHENAATDTRVSCAGSMAYTPPVKQPDHVCVRCVNHPAATSDSGCERAGINDFSDEILLQIIRWVNIGSLASGGRIPKDLFNLAVCSRRFQQLAEPELYSEFGSNNQRHFLLFLRRILARPDLARCLRRLWVAACSNDADCLLPVHSELADEDWARIRAVVDETSRSEDEAARWIKAVELGQWAAVISLILSVTPNLEELDISNWSYDNDDYGHLLDALERAQILQNSCEESPFSMSKLRRVSVDYYDTENGYEFDHVIPFLKLKSVQAFSGDMVFQDNSQYEELNDQRLKDSPLKLTTTDLAFTNSVISHYSMNIILRCFPHLEKFYYEFGGARVGYAEFEPPRMMAALEHLKSCLKDLTLISYEWDGGSNKQLYPIGSLAGFQKLLSIRANASIMIGERWSDDLDDDDSDDEGFAKTQHLVGAVPPTLESLSLEDCSNHVVRHIFELVLQKPWRTPALRKLDLGWEGVKYPDKDSPREPTLHPGFTKGEAAKLTTECEAADIEIVVKYLPPIPKLVSFVRPEEPLDDNAAALGSRPIPPIPTSVHRYFEYPYEGYEEYCEQNGCDPETGRPTMSPFSNQGFVKSA